MRSISTDYMEAPRGPRPTRSRPAQRRTEERLPATTTTIERAREIREIAARYIAEHGLWRSVCCLWRST